MGAAIVVTALMGAAMVVTGAGTPATPSSEVPTSGSSTTAVPCPELIPIFEQFFNRHPVRWTRDRTNRTGWGRNKLPAGYKVSSVERLHHPARWQQYCAARGAVDPAVISPVTVQTGEINKALAGEADPLQAARNECYFFRGSQAISQIIEKNFDVSRAKPSNESLLGGHKVYFAELGGKSDEHTGKDNEVLRMLVCRVVLGRSFYTEEPSPSEATKTDFDRMLRTGEFQSLRAFRRATTEINEFAITDTSLVYPEYVVTYSRVPP